MLLLFPLIIERATTVAAAMPEYYQSLRASMVSNPNHLVVRLSAFLPATLPGAKPIAQTTPGMQTSAEQALGHVASATQAIFMTTAIVLLTVHWTLSGPRTIRSWLLLAPIGRRDSIGELIAAIETKVGFYIAGQGILCLAIGVLALMAYLFIGLPNALVLALIAGVLEAVPMLGPVLGAVPAAVIALSIAPAKFVWVVVATIVIQQLENIVLAPRVMRSAVGVNPFVSLLALFAFGSLYGIAGALMAIPIAAIAQLLLDRFVFGPEATEPEISAGRDYASRLRYEGQDLIQALRRQVRRDEGGSDLRVKQIDQVMDEIESITTDLDTLLAQDRASGMP